MLKTSAEWPQRTGNTASEIHKYELNISANQEWNKKQKDTDTVGLIFLVSKDFLNQFSLMNSLH